MLAEVSRERLAFLGGKVAWHGENIASESHLDESLVEAFSYCS